MSSYHVKLMLRAQKDLDGLSGKMLARFEEIILGLYDEPRPHNSMKLSGGGSRWRIRADDYRILYEIDDESKLVNIYRTAHRRDVYR